MASMQKVHFNGRGFDYRSRKAQNTHIIIYSRGLYLYIRDRSVGFAHLDELWKDKRNEIAVQRMIFIRLVSTWIPANFHVSYQVSLVPNKLLCKGFITLQSSSLTPPSIYRTKLILHFRVTM